MKRYFILTFIIIFIILLATQKDSKICVINDIDSAIMEYMSVEPENVDFDYRVPNFNFYVLNENPIEHQSLEDLAKKLILIVNVHSMESIRSAYNQKDIPISKVIVYIIGKGNRDRPEYKLYSKKYATPDTEGELENYSKWYITRWNANTLNYEIITIINSD